MPLSTGSTAAEPSVRIVFDQDTYQSGERISFRVVVDPPRPAAAEVFTGTVTVAGQAPRQVSGTVAVREPVECGPFSHPGYDIVRDPSDPMRFVASPKGVTS